MSQLLGSSHLLRERISTADVISAATKAGCRFPRSEADLPPIELASSHSDVPFVREHIPLHLPDETMADEQT